jgi:hypothetical protein
VLATMKELNLAAGNIAHVSALLIVLSDGLQKWETYCSVWKEGILSCVKLECL